MKYEEKKKRNRNITKLRKYITNNHDFSYKMNFSQKIFMKKKTFIESNKSFYKKKLLKVMKEDIIL